MSADKTITVTRSVDEWRLILRNLRYEMPGAVQWDEELSSLYNEVTSKTTEETPDGQR